MVESPQRGGVSFGRRRVGCAAISKLFSGVGVQCKRSANLSTRIAITMSTEIRTNGLQLEATAPAICIGGCADARLRPMSGHFLRNGRPEADVGGSPRPSGATPETLRLGSGCFAKRDDWQMRPPVDALDHKSKVGHTPRLVRRVARPNGIAGSRLRAISIACTPPSRFSVGVSPQRPW